MVHVQMGNCVRDTSKSSLVNVESNDFISFANRIFLSRRDINKSIMHSRFYHHDSLGSPREPRVVATSFTRLQIIYILQTRTAIRTERVLSRRTGAL